MAADPLARGTLAAWGRSPRGRPRPNRGGPPRQPVTPPGEWVSTKVAKAIIISGQSHRPAGNAVEPSRVFTEFLQ
eukprot:6140573-Pyramimonas_sp.AAC.1